MSRVFFKSYLAATALVLLGACRSTGPRDPASVNAPACVGKDLARIDLSNQFPPTKDQTKYGICYSYAASALFEAALYRIDGQVRSFSSSLGACLMSTDDRYAGSYSTSARAKAMNSAEARYMDGGDVALAIKAVLDKGRLAPDDFDKQFELIDRLQQEGKQMWKPLEHPSPRPWYALTEWNDLAAARKDYVNVSRQLTETYFDKNKNRLTKIDSKIFRVEMPLPGVSLKEADACSPERQRQITQTLMSALCEGVPTAINIRMNGVETSPDGGATWRPHGSSAHSIHFMVLQGLDQRGEKAYFNFRNSWRAGSKELPTRSQARLPATDVCKILNIITLKTAYDRPLSFQPTCEYDSKAAKISCR